MAELDQMSVEMLESVSHYVRRLRHHARTVNKRADKEEVPDIVLSLLGAGTPVADDDLNARKAYNEYLEDYTALKAKADAIITRNGKDFTASKLPVMTATEYLATLE